MQVVLSAWGMRGDRAGFGADAARLQRWMGQWVFGFWLGKNNFEFSPEGFLFYA